jgi:hypothetical protein
VTPSAATWRRVIDQAHDGDARHLLELLLKPATTHADGRVEFYALPDDAELRLRIVHALAYGAWRPPSGRVDDAFVKTHGQGKPALHPLEVAAAAVAEAHGVDLEPVADALGVRLDTLKRKPKKARRSTHLPPGQMP